MRIVIGNLMSTRARIRSRNRVAAGRRERVRQLVAALVAARLVRR